MISKASLSSKFAIISLFTLLIFFANLKYKQWKNQQAIEKEKQNLTLEAETFNKKNQDLSNSLTYLTSESYKEKIARIQLNMKKDGEIAYSFSQANTSIPDTLPSTPIQTGSNFQKWWVYFFSNN